MIEVLIADDHELVRTGIRRLLDDTPDVRVTHEASSGEEAVKLARQKRPDVVLMDINMPGIGGLEATRKLVQIYPDLPVIIVTVHQEDPFPSRMLKAGARGYLTKGARAEEMVKAIKEVFHGHRYISAEVAQTLALAAMPGQGASVFETLSQREMQVMLMLIQGAKVQDISTQLHLSPKTISTYRYRLFDKLKVRNDAEMTRLAIRHGLLEE